MSAPKRNVPVKKSKAKRKHKKKKSKKRKLKGGNMFAAAGAELLADKGGEVVDGLLSSSGLVNPNAGFNSCLLYTSPSPRDRTRSRMPSSA